MNSKYPRHEFKTRLPHQMTRGGGPEALKTGGAAQSPPLQELSGLQPGNSWDKGPKFEDDYLSITLHYWSTYISPQVQEFRIGFCCPAHNCQQPSIGTVQPCEEHRKERTHTWFMMLWWGWRAPWGSCTCHNPPSSPRQTPQANVVMWLLSHMTPDQR